MGGVKQLWQMILVAAVVGLAALAFGQDAPDTQAPAGPSTATPAPTSAEDSELALEVQQLRNEVERLKRQVAYLNSAVTELESERMPPESTATRPAAKAPKKGVTASSTPAITADAPAPDPDEKVTKTVLVFRDGHKTEAVNYAIVGQTLWIYTETDSKKMPLADLDVAATKSANSDRGVTFQVPPTK
jgi:outer membrane murein-binding lipoprotein Lpp